MSRDTSEDYVVVRTRQKVLIKVGLAQESLAACSRVCEEADARWQARLQEHAAQSDALLAEKCAALEVCSPLAALNLAHLLQEMAGFLAPE